MKWQLSNRPRRRFRRAVVLTASITSGLVAAKPASAATALHVVALGDSYTAGNGADPNGYFGTSGCYRNHANYAETFWKLNGASGSYVNAACSTKKIADVPAQVAELSQSQRTTANLVFLSIGGNDLNFDAIAKSCFVLLGDLNACVTANEAAWDSLDSMINRTKALLSSLGTQFPNARIVLVGYPLLATAHTIHGEGTSYDAGREVGLLGTFADQKQAAIVAELARAPWRLPNRFVFYSRATLFAGHELYSDCVPACGVAGRVFLEAVGQFRGAAGKASSPG
jgi:lysophospholipase L1-like esterase